MIRASTLPFRNEPHAITPAETTASAISSATSSTVNSDRTRSPPRKATGTDMAGSTSAATFSTRGGTMSVTAKATPRAHKPSTGISVET